jgi:glycyl-tRNA synthetase
LKLNYDLAPYKFAVFPLQKKPIELVTKAEQVYEKLAEQVSTDFDTTGSMGKLYRRHDEIGTPFCVTIDHQTLEDNTITIRFRDSMKQIRIHMDELVLNVQEFVKNNRF